MSAYEEQQLKKLESALAALAPRPAALDRDRLLFEAGRRSVRSTLFWPLSTLAMTALSALLMVALLSRPVRPTVLSVPAVPTKSGPSEAIRPTDSEDAPAEVAPAPATPESNVSSGQK